MATTITQIMDSDDEDATAPISCYGMSESRKRLERDGFHPNVTSKTPMQVEKEVIERLRKQIKRKSRREFYDSQKSRLAPRRVWRGSGRGRGKGRGKGSGKGLGVLTMGPWLYTRNFKNSAARKKTRNRPVADNVFKDGHKSAMNVSKTSSEVFKLVGLNVKRWDFTAMNYIVDAPSSVMVVMVPKYTVGDIREVHDRYPFEIRSDEWKYFSAMLELQGHFDYYKMRSIEMEQSYFNWAQHWRPKCLRGDGPFWVTENHEVDPQTTEDALDWWKGDEYAINVMGSLKPLGETWSANQFVGSGNKPHVISLHLAMEGLLKLMFELYDSRAHIRVLHLHDVPLLDRRMLAVILRGLPHVVMVGVYSCPLIHFGDVIPMLDLIHEINIYRRKREMPEIKALDFFPYFNQGMPYAHENAATYGISWGSLPMDIAQRGFYAILLKAFMKSKAMGIELLFSPDHAFMEYLTKVPNTPLGVFGFLDAIYRYLEVKRDNVDRVNLKLQAIYDIVKPIRMALVENLASDWPKYYTKEMAKSLLFCSSCGYETFEEFFPANSKNRLQRHRRVCSGCLLQRCLDREIDHFKAHKKRLIDMVCPDWDRAAFNKDAPLFEGGAELIHLESTETDRPLPRFPTFVVDGLVRISPYYEPLMRDNKFQFDSLVGLPSLRDIAEHRRTTCRWWSTVIEAIKSDVLRRGIQELRNQYPTDDKKKGIPAFGPTRLDGGAPDHQDEAQPEKSADGKKSFYDQRGALNAANWITKKNW
ncbi:hypothetical protein TARUN_6913 [Trichoderma arundinaceum]|uniref:Uncharacterized protein n=1 Tax=Trichoderma arundinaceum TaxID=490622 RepID=A0A395NHP6_TRIAR|nr:hypothetical protein TARUN_6913 [Trichoderma arundinaceum]